MRRIFILAALRVKSTDMTPHHCTLTVASVSLQALFAEEGMTDSIGQPITGQLCLPEYQRPYRWHSAQVWQLAQDLAAHRRSGAAHDYYLGSLILHRTAEGLLHIIDGQQRITSMGILAVLAQCPCLPQLHYSAPESQQCIRANLQTLSTEPALQVTLAGLDLARIHVTLVITSSEDDAYRFFETQNSGGVRLSGVDIAKAHHLHNVETTAQNPYAQRWEALQHLQPLVDSVMRVRLWDSLAWRELASAVRQPRLLRSQVIEELATHTLDDGGDTAYQWQVLQVAAMPQGGQPQAAETGQLLAMGPCAYAMRQPLQAGRSSIHYLESLHQLQQLFLPPRVTAAQLAHAHSTGHAQWLRLYQTLVVESDASGYLRQLLDAALLLYLSRFGSAQLMEAALWLHRMVYAVRVSNDKMVRESSVQKFAHDTRFLDWVASAFTHAQLMQRLQAFEVKVSPENFEPGWAKRRFVEHVLRTLGAMDDADAWDWAQVAQWYDPQLQTAIYHYCQRARACA